MKKVLCVTPEMEYTGALFAFKNIVYAFKRLGCDVDILTYVRGSFEDEFENVNIIEISENDISPEKVRTIEAGYDYIFASTIETYKFSYYSGGIKPVIWLIQEGTNISNFFWNIDRKKALLSSKKLYVVSEYVQEYLEKTFHIKSEIIHNVLNDSSDKNDFAEEKTGKEIKFLTLGTIEERKGYDILINAFEKVQKSYANIRLEFAGRKWDGAVDFYDQIMKRVSGNQGIKYLGEIHKREEIFSLIRNADVVVVPSRDESCSMVTIEAAMLSKATIVTANVGAKYLINEKSGWIVESNDVGALAKAMIEAISRKKELPSMGKEARVQYLKLATPDLLDKRLSKIMAEVGEDTTFSCFDVVSFDMFDTLVGRRVQKPENIFNIVENQLKNGSDFDECPAVLRDNFTYIRASTEKWMYAKICDSCKQDITIDEIYDQIGMTYSLTVLMTNKIKELEIETERNNLYAIQENINKIKKLRDIGKNVIVISDMYFNSNILRQFLLEFDDIFTQIPIYVSSEYGCKKNTGRLFELIARRNCYSYDRWLHIGDDFNNDVVQPERLGIRTSLFVSERFHDFELNLMTGYGKDLNIQRAISYVREFRQNLKPSPMFDLGLSYGGFILFPYVNWCLENAVKLNVEHLYFIARDGYVLQKIARKIIKTKKLNIETSYVYISRVSARDPVVAADKKRIGELKSYLRQEISTTKRFSFVDLSGTGKTIECVIENLDQNASKRYISTFYLYLNENEKKLTHQVGMLKLNELYSVGIELLARAPHGQTLGYSVAANGKILPVLDNSENQVLSKVGYEEYIRGVCRAADLFLTKKEYERYNYDLRIFLDYLKYLCNLKQSQFLADFLGRIPFLLDGKSDKFYEYAPKIACDCIDEVKKGIFEYKGNNLTWSLMRSSKTVQAFFTHGGNLSSNEIELKKRIECLEKNLLDCYNSRTFRVGKAITYIPRIVINLYRKYCKYK